MSMLPGTTTTWRAPWAGWVSVIRRPMLRACRWAYQRIAQVRHLADRTPYSRVLLRDV